MEPTPLPTPEPTPVPEPAVTPKPASEILVWHSLPGRGSYYHLDENCSGMYGAKQYTLESSVEAGFKRCNTCNAPDLEALEGQTVVWVSQDNRMHITDECDGAQGGQIMILEEALALETPLEYCEDCGAKAYMDYLNAYLGSQADNAPDATAGLSTDAPESEPTEAAAEGQQTASPEAEATPEATPRPAITPNATFRTSQSEP